MASCKHHDICGLPAESDSDTGLCILHSNNPEKASQAFEVALKAHCKESGDFRMMVFPENADFSGFRFIETATFGKAKFLGWADFTGAEFSGNADFIETTFCKRAYFDQTVFRKRAVFLKATFTETVFFGNTVFHEGSWFDGATFHQYTDFRKTTFADITSFSGMTFSQGVHFGESIFMQKVDFTAVSFSQIANFEKATFSQEANFFGACFSGRAIFNSATFAGDAYFPGAQFSSGADFGGTRFVGVKLSFHSSRFHGRTLFASRGLNELEETSLFHSSIFEEVQEVDFRDVVIEPPDALVFRHANLQHCRLLDTDLRKVEMTGVQWPWSGRWFNGRPCVYDELLPQSPLTRPPWWHVTLRERCNAFRTIEFCPKAPDGVCKVCEAWEEADRFCWGWLETCGHACTWVKQFYRERLLRLPHQGSLPWSQIERLYRELKQNHEDRRDYARAGDFHYGEKEMQRRNPQTPWSLRLFLWLYWLASGYGVFWIRPLLWAVMLWIVSTGAYLWIEGLLPKGAQAPSPNSLPVSDWPRVALYTLRVMTFLRPDELIPHGWGALAVHTLDSLLGPLFLGLFVLAISQRLKR